MIEHRDFESANDMFSFAAGMIADLSRKAIDEKGFFSLAVSGGSTPSGLFSLLASPASGHNYEWDKIHVFWVDERCVPSTDSMSNFKTANELWLDKVDIPEENIHRIKGELSPSVAAFEYANEINSFFGSPCPSFDLILLGMGPDGHTASLFPDTPSLEALDPIISVPPPKTVAPAVPRVTFSFEIINNAANIVFMITGESKRKIMDNILAGNVNKFSIPAAGVVTSSPLFCLSAP